MGNNQFARPAFNPPKFPSVTRDFSFVVGKNVPAGDLVKAITKADKDNITNARIFDLYEGTDLPENTKVLGVEVVMQPIEKTYTKEQINTISDKIIAACKKLGAELR